MQAIRSVGIFLGSSTGINPLFGRKIADLCETFARRSIAVVYGGGNVGLMGLLADTAIKNGVHVTGVIPRHLIERELGHDAWIEAIASQQEILRCRLRMTSGGVTSRQFTLHDALGAPARRA